MAMFNDIVICPGGKWLYSQFSGRKWLGGKSTIGHRHAQVLYPKIEEQYALYHNITVLVECRKVEMGFQGVKYVLMLGYVFLYIRLYTMCEFPK